MLLCVLIQTPTINTHHKLNQKQIITCERIMSKSIKSILKGEDYQKDTTIKDASNLVLHQVDQLTELTSTLNAELEEQINEVLRDIEETSLRLVHNLIDILKNSFSIKTIQSDQFITDDSTILTTSRGKRSTEHKIDENLINQMINEVRMPVITNRNEMIEQSMVILIHISEKVKRNLINVKDHKSGRLEILHKTKEKLENMLYYITNYALAS